jgi:hypothetical protein
MCGWPACDTRTIVHKSAQNRLNCARWNSFTVHLLRSNPSANVLRFLYVPLLVFAVPDAVGWLRKGEKCRDPLKLSEILRWISRSLKLLRNSLENC